MSTTRAALAPEITISGNTPYGFFDDKAKFIADTERFCIWSRLRHGISTLQVELDDLDLIAAYEEATTEYSSIAAVYRAKDTLGDFLGTPTGSNISLGSGYDDGTAAGIEQGMTIRTTNLLRRFLAPISDEAAVGGTFPVFTGSVTLNAGQQIYDLNTTLTGSHPGSLTGSQIKIVNIFHDVPRYGLRYNSGAQFFGNESNMYAGGSNAMFRLFPIWPQMLYSQNFDFASKIRRSWYSWEVHGKELWVHPVPTGELITLVRVEYQVVPHDPRVSGDGSSTRGVSQFADAPYGNLDYHSLNAFSRNWIKKYAFAISKEVLGLKRSKYRDIPYVDGSMTLNGDALMDQGAAEKTQLRDELKEWLDSLTVAGLLKNQAEATEAARPLAADIPLGIFFG